MFFSVRFGAKLTLSPLLLRHCYILQSFLQYEFFFLFYDHLYYIILLLLLQYNLCQLENVLIHYSNSTIVISFMTCLELPFILIIPPMLTWCLWHFVAYWWKYCSLVTMSLIELRLHNRLFDAIIRYMLPYYSSFGYKFNWYSVVGSW